LQPFFNQNIGLLHLNVDKTGSLVLDAAQEYKLPDCPLEVGLPSVPLMLQWYINNLVLKGPYEDLKKECMESRGKLFIDLVELFSGRKIPGMVKSFSVDSSRAAEQCMEQYTAILQFLARHGALMNNVLPEFLLDTHSLHQVLELRVSRNDSATLRRDRDLWCAHYVIFLSAFSSMHSCLSVSNYKTLSFVVSFTHFIHPRGVHALIRQLAVCRHELMRQYDWDLVTSHAWSFMLLQCVKIFIFHRIDVRSFQDLPGMDMAHLPPPAALTTSNVYSVAESILLTWADHHMRGVFPQVARRIMNFDRDFVDGLALGALLIAHWPPLQKIKGQMIARPTQSVDYHTNAKLVVHMLELLQCPWQVEAEEICDPKPCSLIFLVAYLYTWLPQMIPRTTICFRAKLQEEQEQEVELQNPTSKCLSYLARLKATPTSHWRHTRSGWNPMVEECAV
jgi:hypothetical protein